MIMLGRRLSVGFSQTGDRCRAVLFDGIAERLQAMGHPMALREALAAQTFHSHIGRPFEHAIEQRGADASAAKALLYREGDLDRGAFAIGMNRGAHDAHLIAPAEHDVARPYVFVGETEPHDIRIDDVIVGLAKPHAAVIIVESMQMTAKRSFVEHLNLYTHYSFLFD
jgi:hypothetical protein